MEGKRGRERMRKGVEMVGRREEGWRGEVEGGGMGWRDGGKKGNEGNEGNEGDEGNEEIREGEIGL